MNAIGLGTGSIGGQDLDESQVVELLEGAVEAGVSFFDSARSYGEAEARIGRHLARFGDRIQRATKIGYGIDGTTDWTAPCITAGVDAALQRMQVDAIDVVFLHSCPIDTLQRGEVIDALKRAVDSGKVGVAGYSGDGDALRWAVNSGAFGAVEASYSVLDRQNAEALQEAKAKGLRTVAKRGLANAVWRHDTRPDANDTGPYWDRWRALDVELDDPLDTFIRFTASSAFVDVALIGTSRLAHLAEALDAVGRGPLPLSTRDELDRRYDRVGRDWPAII